MKRIGFYPDNENYAVWDYTIGREIADMVVVINTDKTGKINYVTWESWNAINKRMNLPKGRLFAGHYSYGYNE